MSVVRNAEDPIKVHVAQLLTVLEHRRGTAVDVLLPFRILAMDVTGKQSAYVPRMVLGLMDPPTPQYSLPHSHSSKQLV